jgi:hypothetical protein
MLERLDALLAQRAGDPADGRFAGGGVMDDTERLRHLRRNASSYAATLRDTRKVVNLGQRHTDQMLTWSAWLMGAGLLALPAAFKDNCTSAKADLLWVSIPWAVGLLFAYVGRMVAAEHRGADAYHYAAKWGGLQALLVRANLTPTQFGEQLQDQMSDRTPQLVETAAKTKRLRYWTNGFYLVPAACFVVGVSIVLWRIGGC